MVYMFHICNTAIVPPYDTVYKQIKKVTKTGGKVQPRIFWQMHGFDMTICILLFFDFVFNYRYRPVRKRGQWAISMKSVNGIGK